MTLDTAECSAVAVHRGKPSQVRHVLLIWLYPFCDSCTFCRFLVDVDVMAGLRVVLVLI